MHAYIHHSPFATKKYCTTHPISIHADQRISFRFLFGRFIYSTFFSQRFVIEKLCWLFKSLRAFGFAHFSFSVCIFPVFPPISFEIIIIFQIFLFDMHAILINWFSLDLKGITKCTFVVACASMGAFDQHSNLICEIQLHFECLWKENTKHTRNEK